MQSTSIEQRRAAVAAIGKTVIGFAPIAELSHPIIHDWVLGREISKESEAKIMTAVDRAGWRFHSGGVMPKRRV